MTLFLGGATLLIAIIIGGYVIFQFDELKRLIENKNRVSDQRIRMMASELVDSMYTKLTSRTATLRELEDTVYNKLKEKLQ